MRLIVFLTAIEGDGYSMPSNASTRVSDEPLIIEVCCLMQRCQDSLRPNKPSERTLTAQRRRSGLPEKADLDSIHKIADGRNVMSHKESNISGKPP